MFEPRRSARLLGAGLLVLGLGSGSFAQSGANKAVGGDDPDFALAVKEWLVANVGIAPERIQTIGKGNSEAIVGPEKSVDEQQPSHYQQVIEGPAAPRGSGMLPGAPG